MTDEQRQLADRLFPIVVDPDNEIELKNIPPEQRQLHTETADLTVFSLFQYLVNGKIQIPEFQRGYVWTRSQASRLIESLVIQCPIPVVYFHQESDNTLIVIDGNQRLWTLKLFLNDAFALQGLTTYPELNGQSWSTLDPRFRDHISNRTIRCITILKGTHPQIKFDVFERLNTGSVKLNAQELRHGLNFGRLVQKLDEIAKNPSWRKSVGIHQDKRMKGAELVLRFLAMRHGRASYFKPLSAFLDQFSDTHRNTDDATLAEWKSDFDTAMSRVLNALGRLAFRTYGDDLKPSGQFNAALYDAQTIAFAETDNNKIISQEYDPIEFQAASAELFNDLAFSKSIKRATSDESSVRTRIRLYKRFVDNF